ncbi:MAG: cadherin-like beta sandwich domain-containing protein [Agarilytica sp.]
MNSSYFIQTPNIRCIKGSVLMSLRLLYKLFYSFVICSLLYACGGEGSGSDDEEGDEVGEILTAMGAISLPEGVDTEGEYPVTVQAFYNSDCAEAAPEPVFSDENGDYNIDVACDDGLVYFVYLSRSGNYALVDPFVRRDFDENVSEEVVLFAVETVTVSFDVDDGFTGAYDHIEMEFGIFGSDNEPLYFGGIETFDGLTPFLGHNVTASDDSDIALDMPVRDSLGNTFQVNSRLVGDYPTSSGVVSGQLASHQEYFGVVSGEENSALIEFTGATELISRALSLSTEGVRGGTSFGSGTIIQHVGGDGVSIVLSNIAYRQDRAFLSLLFMENLDVEVNGETVASGQELEFDLTVESIPDIDIAIRNTQTNEESSYTYAFGGENVSDNVRILYHYFIDSDVRGPYTNDTNKSVFDLATSSVEREQIVDYSVNDVELYFFKDSVLQTITIDGVEYPQQTVLGETFTTITVPIVDGDNEIEIVVTPEDRTIPQVYALNIIRTPIDFAELYTLSVWGGGIEGITNFDNETTNYSITTEEESHTLRLVANTGSTFNIRLNASEEVFSYYTYEGDVLLNLGENILEVDVLSADGSVTRTYTVTITREEEMCPPESEAPECLGPA